MALYSTYTTDFRAYRIYSTYSTYSKELGESGAVGGGILQGIPAFPVVYILPERLLALVRPAFELVLRRIQSLKAA